jgi:integrase
MPTVKTVIKPDGSKSYRFTADVSTTADGKRRQQRYSFPTLREAKAELAKLGYQRPRGEYTPRSTATVADVIDTYLRAACRGKEQNTVQFNTLSLRIPREQLGTRKAQSVTRDDIERLIDYALTSGRKRGGKPGTGLGVRSVRAMLSQLSAAFEQAVDDGQVAKNPCRRVRVASTARPERVTWGVDHLVQWLTATENDRLRPAWRLLACGLRRGEVLGLMWADIDWDAGTVRIGRSRVLVNATVITKAPKTERGYRVVPVDAVTLGALRALHDLQQIEASDATPAYSASGFVAVDELGSPVHPEWLSDEFQRITAAAGLPRRVHDTRHAVNSAMAAAGVADHVRAAWCGHTVAVNVSTYTHANKGDLVTAGAALATIFGAA